MSILTHLQGICNLIPSINETLNELHLEKQNITTKELIELISALLNLINSNKDVKLQCLVTLHLADTVNEIITQFSPSLRKMEVDEISQDSLEFLKNYNQSTVIERLLGIVQEGEFYEISNFISDLKTDSKLFTDCGFFWSIAVSMSKKPFELVVEKILSSFGFTSQAVFFTKNETFNEFLHNNNPRLIFERALQSTGNLVIAIGGMNNTLAGPFLILTDLWDLKKDDLNKTKNILLDNHTLQQKTNFFMKIVSPTAIDNFIVPDFFELTLELGTTGTPQSISFLDILRAFHVILAISSHAILNKETDRWNLKITGIKIIQAQLHLADNRINLDGEPFSQDINSLFSLYHWIFDDLSQAKVALARRTIALYSSNFKDFLLESKRIQISLEAVYNQYLDETVSEILETQQRFAEYLLGWTKKDIELKMKLRDVISETALGGLGSILGVMISLATQHIQPQVANIALFVVPIAFTVFLAITIIGLIQLYGTIDKYTTHHESQLQFYERILGSEFIPQIAGIEDPAQIRANFHSTIRRYQYGLVALSIISIGLWFYWLINGYF